MESGKYAATVVSVGQFLSIFQKTNNENLQPNEKSSFLKILKTMFHGWRLTRDSDFYFFAIVL